MLIISTWSNLRTGMHIIEGCWRGLERCRTRASLDDMDSRTMSLCLSVLQYVQGDCGNGVTGC